MKLAHIAPTKVLPKILADADYHLVLNDPARSDDAYATFYRQLPPSAYVILDCNAYEKPKESLPLDLVEEAIGRIIPSEVILPDTPTASANTNVRMAFEGSECLERYGIPFMAVPHGETWADYFYCAQMMSRVKGVRCLGIVNHTYQDYGRTRGDVLRALHQELPKMQFHMLGGMKDLSDMMDPAVRQLARGMDTCKFIRWAEDCELVTTTHIPKYPGRGNNFFDRDFDETQLVVARENINYWNAFAEC